MTYSYDAWGRLISVGTPSDADFYATYTYHADGRLNVEILANGAETRNHFYNPPGWLLRIDGDRFTEDITHTTGWGGTAGYHDGRIKTTSFTYNWAGKPADYAVQYTYDDVGQLTSADNNLNNAWDIGVANSISYDANGNILDLTRGSATKNYTYYFGTNKVQNTDGSGNDYGYDANANVTRADPKTIPTITYDSYTQRPTSVSMSSGASLTLEYGGDTQRVLKNYTSGTTTNSRLYLHGENDYPLIEKNKTSATAETLAVYIYGSNGAVAKRVGSTVLFLLKDHLGSTRVVMDASGLVRTYYDYDALGNLIRTGTTNEVKYQFTGQEIDESSLHNYRARLYDSDLGKFYAVDPAGQGWSPFAYAGNNPVIMVDRDGKLFFVPFLVGAAIGGLWAGASYSIMAGEAWTLKGFGSAVGLGALGGGLSAGIGSLGTSGLTNIAYGILGQSASWAATTAASGGELTRSGLAGALAAGIVGGLMPGYTAQRGGWLANSAAEIMYGAGKGAVTSSVAALVSTRSLRSLNSAIRQGARYGAANSFATIALMGYAIEPKGKSGLKKAEEHFSSIGYSMGRFEPVFRRGGLTGLIHGKIMGFSGLAIGRNLLVYDDEAKTYIHETMHYYQQLFQGWGAFYGRAAYEQWFMKGDPYETKGTNEWFADDWAVYYNKF